MGSESNGTSWSRMREMGSESNYHKLMLETAKETTMKDHPSHIVALKGDGAQDKLFARSSRTTSSTQVLPGGDGGDGKPPKPENEIDILINDPKANATVSVFLSQGTFTVRGTVAVIGSVKFSSVEVVFGNSSKPASGKSSWTCTSP